MRIRTPRRKKPYFRADLLDKLPGILYAKVIFCPSGILETFTGISTGYMPGSTQTIQRFVRGIPAHALSGGRTSWVHSRRKSMGRGTKGHRDYLPFGVHRGDQVETVQFLQWGHGVVRQNVRNKLVENGASTESFPAEDLTLRARS